MEYNEPGIDGKFTESTFGWMLAVGWLSLADFAPCLPQSCRAVGQ